MTANEQISYQKIISLAPWKVLLLKMEPDELSIRGTIDAHIKLAEAYKRMMTLIDKQGFFFVLKDYLLMNITLLINEE